MLTSMSEQDLAEFREKMQSSERNASGHAPRELRVRGAKLAVRMLEAGEPVAAVAKALGVTAPTVKQWGSTALAKRETPVTLVPVEVVAEARKPTSKRPSVERRISVTAPSGYRVDGLSVAEAAALLRALR
jgi:transposase-like protein